MLSLNYTLYHLHYLTSSTYQIDGWPMDHAVLFPFLLLFSYPRCHVMGWLVTSHHTTWSGTYYSFTSDEPCAHFLIYHLYLSHLYLLHIQGSFSPRFLTNKFVQPDHLTLPHVIPSPHLVPSYHLVLLYCPGPSYCLILSPCPTLHHSFSISTYSPTTESSLSHQEITLYSLIAPSEPHWTHASIKLYGSLFLI